MPYGAFMRKSSYGCLICWFFHVSREKHCKCSSSSAHGNSSLVNMVGGHMICRLALLQLLAVKSWPILSSDLNSRNLKQFPFFPGILWTHLTCLRLLVTIFAGTGETPKLGTVTTFMLKENEFLECCAASFYFSEVSTFKESTYRKYLTFKN